MFMECKFCGRATTDKQRRGRTRCNSCNTKLRRLKCKLKAVEYLGGKCQRCQKVVHLSGFEFHHKNPSQKDFAIGRAANKSWAIVQNELDKCELLCALCHAEEHSDRYEERFLEEIRKASK